MLPTTTAVLSVCWAPSAAKVKQGQVDQIAVLPGCSGNHAQDTGPAAEEGLPAAGGRPSEGRCGAVSAHQRDYQPPQGTAASCFAAVYRAGRHNTASGTTLPVLQPRQEWSRRVSCTSGSASAHQTMTHTDVSRLSGTTSAQTGLQFMEMVWHVMPAAARAARH